MRRLETDSWKVTCTVGFFFRLLFEALGIREFSPASWVTELFDRVACDNTMRQLKVCENVCFLLVGFDAKQTNMVGKASKK